MKQAKASGHQALLQGKTDEELLAYLSGPGIERHLTESAFGEFYNRHARYLYFICKRDYQATLGEEGVQDLVQETFIRVYEKAGTFKSDGLTDKEKLTLRTHGWLRRIAANLFLSKRRAQTGVPETLLGPDMLAGLAETLPNDEQDSTESPKITMMKEALSTLSEREREIMQTIYQWYEPGKKLPSHIVDELTERYKTTPENIRKIRSRARQKIEAYLKDNSDR
ncbi:MAG: sigma-70 family RNA polymerase sigma factor [Chlorobiales bacterium]|nr:sigma-70 family RNA polymerase sigma factor [Chlorobiales bacterium]